VTARRTACSGHRDVLLDFIDRRELGPRTDAALDHLARCRACERDLETTAMAVLALRRLHREARAVEPPADAWQQLRVRVDRPRGPVWRWRTTLAGLALGAGLVGTIIAPVAMWSPRVAYLQEPGTEATIFDARRLAEHRAEARALDQQRLIRVGPAASSPTVAAPSPVEAGWTGPDGLGISTRASAGTPPTGRSR
jgi:anti-sigma factor RsiW